MKKKTLLFMAAFTIAVTLFAAFGISVSAYSGGSGTESNPYLISNINDLKELHDKVLSGNTYRGKYFKVTAGISTGSDWDPISYYYSKADNKPFEGTIDGCSYTINLHMSTAQVSPALFGYNKGTIKNLGVFCDINLNSYVCGGIVGWNEGTIHNCYTGGSIKGTSSRCGVIAGFSKGTITNCRNNCSVEGGAELGGVVGYNEGTLSGCRNTASVTGTGDRVGGITGYSAKSISRCFNTGDIAGSHLIGGITAETYFHVNISNCYNTGAVSSFSSSSSAAGIAVWVHGCITNCYNVGSVTAYAAYGICQTANYLTSNFYLRGTANNGSLSSDSSGSIEARPADWFKFQYTLKVGIL